MVSAGRGGKATPALPPDSLAVRGWPEAPSTPPITLEQSVGVSTGGGVLTRGTSCAQGPQYRRREAGTSHFGQLRAEAGLLGSQLSPPWPPSAPQGPLSLPPR